MFIHLSFFVKWRLSNLLITDILATLLLVVSDFNFNIKNRIKNLFYVVFNKEEEIKTLTFVSDSDLIILKQNDWDHVKYFFKLNLFFGLYIILQNLLLSGVQKK